MIFVRPGKCVCGGGGGGGEGMGGKGSAGLDAGEGMHTRAAIFFIHDTFLLLLPQNRIVL